MYRPHCICSVLTTAVKILPYRPPARVITAKYNYVRHKGSISVICTCIYFFLFQVTFYHLLKLFQTESALASGKKQLVSEFYDEIVSEISC